MLKLYNTLTKKTQPFKPLHEKRVSLYTCGPTVYSFAHLGNLKTYLFEDILKRVLIYHGYQVKHVMNITDVGHLTSNADSGVDKIEQEALTEQKSAWEIAEFYSQAFFNDLKQLNVIFPKIIAKATDYIPEDLELIKELERQGYTYRTSDGIYFDTSKLKDYGKLTGMNFEQLNKLLKAGARVEFSPEKKHLTDFALWKFSPTSGPKRQMEWSSPWGVGFPGWHLECAVINLKFLAGAFQRGKLIPKKAQTIDLHCGGVDHIPIHHTNEIAEVEAVTKKKFVNFWLHGAFLVVKEGRMGKSEGNAVLLTDLIKKGFHPLSYRYLVLTAHYRTPLEFSWESLKASEESLKNIFDFIYDCLWWQTKYQSEKPQNNLLPLNQIHKKWLEALDDDLNTPQALAAFWELINSYYQIRKNPQLKNKINFKAVYQTALEFDKVFGLKLNKITLPKIDSHLKQLITEREQARQQQQWNKADQLRKEIDKLGYLIEDTADGPKIITKEIYRNY
ncbi:MAG: cysteinyl-tRNA synthetase [Patescibacteria group bacterium]|nr:cysteinyl-tRNA synthetase [Patescibacteria group bacterium]